MKSSLKYDETRQKIILQKIQKKNMSKKLMEKMIQDRIIHIERDVWKELNPLLKQTMDFLIYNDIVIEDMSPSINESVKSMQESDIT